MEKVPEWRRLKWRRFQNVTFFNVVQKLLFGFRNGVGCSDALYTVKSVVDHFVKNGCTVSIAALDISKAFDRISYYALLSKLMSRKFPIQFIKVLLSWYSKSFVKVKWGDDISDSFQTLAGVRQGGILSPVLFALYIEDILKELKIRDKDCKINGIFLGCFLYADDILLLSQSVTCIQSMLDICSDVARNLDLLFNDKKSCIMRIEKRCNVKCCDLNLDGKIIAAVEEIKYLGISIEKCLTFSRSYCNAKIKFCRCFNSTYSKASQEVLVNLFKCYCLSTILYACEAVGPS